MEHNITIVCPCCNYRSDTWFFAIHMDHIVDPSHSPGRVCFCGYAANSAWAMEEHLLQFNNEQRQQHIDNYYAEFLVRKACGN